MKYDNALSVFMVHSSAVVLFSISTQEFTEKKPELGLDTS